MTQLLHMDRMVEASSTHHPFAKLHLDCMHARSILPCVGQGGPQEEEGGGRLRWGSPVITRPAGVCGPGDHDTGTGVLRRIETIEVEAL